jgi:hypothetical protein
MMHEIVEETRKGEKKYKSQLKKEEKQKRREQRQRMREQIALKKQQNNLRRQRNPAAFEAEQRAKRKAKDDQ